jgi:ATP-dependent DNA helicase RecG
LASKGEQSKAELQQLLGLKDEKNFREVYLQKALSHEWFERTIPDKPNSKNQKYRLTAKGRTLQELLKTQS